MIVPMLVMLVGCPKPKPVPPPIPPSQIIPQEEPRTPPLPPPAPVELAFAWPDLSACLMSTRMTESIVADKAPISTLNAVGSGVVFAQKQADGNWEISLEDRSGTARHTPSDADLLVAIEEIRLDVDPTLFVGPDGTEVIAVRGMDDVWPKNQPALSALAHQYSKSVEALWLEALPKELSTETLAASWAASWSDGWGFTFGKRWEAGEPQRFTSTAGGEVEAVYLDVVPCKFNEDEPQCVRIELIYDDTTPATPPARLRALLPPGAEVEAERTTGAVERRGELVMEAATGLPWRWTLVEIEEHGFRHGADTVSEFTLKRKQEVSCDWRVAE